MIPLRTFLEAEANEQMFHADRRTVPSTRGGKLMLTGSTLLLGWPLAAKVGSGESFDTLAFFEADWDWDASSLSDGDSDGALRFSWVFFFGGIAWWLKKDA
jgi:hypothetical protein